MEVLKIILVGIFLPLFPFSIIFNAAFERITHPVSRSVMLIAWPMVGIYLIHRSTGMLPDWVIIWALVTAIIYAFRLLAVKDMGLWIGFLATSVWSLQWIGLTAGMSAEVLYQSVLGFSIPLAILALLSKHIETRFGATYADLYGGLAVTTPRLSGVLVFTVLAATATPVFPAFFIVLHVIVSTTPGVVMSILLTWLLWTWASARLLQGFIVGPIVGEKIQDIGTALTWLYALLLVALVFIGVYLAGGRL